VLDDLAPAERQQLIRETRCPLRGRADLVKDQALALPAKAATLAPTECLLAVAVAGSQAGLDLSLRTPSLSHADLRGKSLAIVEVCGTELAGQNSVDALELISNSGGEYLRFAWEGQ
jgi:hypothetical protein